MVRSAEEIYQDALKLTPDEREILEVLLRFSLPLPYEERAEPEMASIDKDRPRT